jgi:hypothetical protein
VSTKKNITNIIIGCAVGIGGFALLAVIITIIVIRSRRYPGGAPGSPTNPDGRIPSRFSGPLAPPPVTPHGQNLATPLVGGGGSMGSL